MWWRLPSNIVKLSSHLMSTCSIESSPWFKNARLFLKSTRIGLFRYFLALTWIIFLCLDSLHFLRVCKIANWSQWVKFQEKKNWYCNIRFFKRSAILFSVYCHESHGRRLCFSSRPSRPQPSDWRRWSNNNKYDSTFGSCVLLVQKYNM